MAFSDYEATPSLGNPIEAYDFLVHGTHYLYVNYDTDIITPGDGVWTAARVSRSSFSRGVETARSSITLTMDEELDIVRLFDEGTPETVVELTVYRIHAIDPDKEKRRLWHGQVVTRKRVDKEIQFVCEVSEISLRTLGLRRRYQRTCPYPLYGPGCNVNKDLHRVGTSIVSVTQAGLVVRVGVADCSPYSGGILAAVVDGLERVRHVVEGSGDSLRLIRPILWGTAGLSVSLYPGCGRTLEICRDKFGNGDNFGGFQYMPRTNPFRTQVY